MANEELLNGLWGQAEAEWKSTTVHFLKPGDEDVEDLQRVGTAWQMKSI